MNRPFPQLGWGRSPYELIPALFGATELVVDPKGGGQFRSFTEALASFNDETADRWYVIRLAGGSKISDENVVGREFVALVGDAGFGPAPACVVSSSSGYTLTAPDKNFLSLGIRWVSTSVNPTDAAVHTVDSGTPWVAGDAECFVVNGSTVAGNGARCFFCDNHGLDLAGEPRQAIAIYNGIDNTGTGPMAYVDAAGFMFFLGGGGSDQGSGAVIRNGGTVIVSAGAGVGSEDTGIGASTEWAVDVDGGLIAFLDCLLSGDNGIKLRNGAVMFAPKVLNFGGCSGTPVDIDATSFALIGDVRLEPFGAPSLTTWIVAGFMLRLYGADWSQGTTGAGGPDQRPTAAGVNPPAGFRFLAFDIAPVPHEIVWTGAAWVDGAGTVFP